MPQNYKNVILPITFYTFLGIFKAFLKILHKIWKNLIFLPQISYFMTYHSKIHNKVSKINTKLCKPVFCPFWTPVTIWKLKNPPTKILVFDINDLIMTTEKCPSVCLLDYDKIFSSPKNRLCIQFKEEYIKEKRFDFIRQTDIKYKPNIEVWASQK